MIDIPRTSFDPMSLLEKGSTQKDPFRKALNPKLIKKLIKKLSKPKHV